MTIIEDVENIQKQLKLVLKDLRQRQIDVGMQPSELFELFDLSDEVR